MKTLVVVGFLFLAPNLVLGEFRFSEKNSILLYKAFNTLEKTDEVLPREADGSEQPDFEIQSHTVKQEAQLRCIRYSGINKNGDEDTKTICRTVGNPSVEISSDNIDPCDEISFGSRVTISGFFRSMPKALNAISVPEKIIRRSHGVLQQLPSGETKLSCKASADRVAVKKLGTVWFVTALLPDGGRGAIQVLVK